MFFHEETEKRHFVPGLRGLNGSIETSDEEKRNVFSRRQLQRATTKMLNKKEIQISRNETYNCTAHYFVLCPFPFLRFGLEFDKFHHLCSNVTLYPIAGGVSLKAELNGIPFLTNKAPRGPLMKSYVLLSSSIPLHCNFTI